MKFYNRATEMEILKRNWANSDSKSIFTVMTGRHSKPSSTLSEKTSENTRTFSWQVCQWMRC